jgi:hypothetical protein
MFHIKAYFSQVLCTNLFTSLLMSISPLSKESIHLTIVAYIEADLNSMLITQVHLVLGTKQRSL